MTTIQFLKDKDGNEQVADLIDCISKEALTTKSFDYIELAQRITFGLSSLKKRGVPPENERIITGISSQTGRPFTLAGKVKDLKHHAPLMEFRVNYRGIGAFRAIFFFIEDSHGEHHIYFTKAVIKSDKSSADFETAIQESKRIRNSFFNNS